MSPENRKPFLVSGRKGLNTSASYAPDGQHIVCTLSLDGNAELYRLDARGGDPARLTNSRAIDTSPAWSPTGREIAFASDRSGQPQLYLMDADGANVRRLTFDVDYTDSPSWSPKGDRLAFVTRVGGGFDVWTCRADGTGAKPVVTGGTTRTPAGRRMVATSCSPPTAMAGTVSGSRTSTGPCRASSTRVDAAPCLRHGPRDARPGIESPVPSPSTRYAARS